MLSFRVIMIQILTGQFPEPSDIFTTLLVPDPSNKKCTIEAQGACEEGGKKAWSHQLGPRQPLTPGLQLSCLEDRPEERLTASTVCTLLMALDVYREIVHLHG